MGPSQAPPVCPGKGAVSAPRGMLTASQAAGSCLKRELVSSTETRFL